jgi:AcrR family transcriptional regulator
MLVRENQAAVNAPRGRGRPQVRSDVQTRDLIVAAAARIFESEGYAAACIADVARNAGVSTKTLYRLIPTKAALFESVVADRIDRFVLEIDHDICATCDAATVIEDLAASYGLFALDPRVADINRLVLAESARFPEIGAYFHEKAVLRIREAMQRPLARLVQRGLIALDDPMEAVEMLRGMMAMDPQRAMMLGLREPPSEAEIRARARRCARIFLNGCAARPEPDCAPAASYAKSD